MTPNLFQISLHKGLALWVKFGANNILKYFLIFPRKQDSTFRANCVIGDNLHDVPSCFPGKIRKILSFAELAQRVAMVKFESRRLKSISRGQVL